MKKRAVSVLFCTAVMLFCLSAVSSAPGTASAAGTDAEPEAGTVTSKRVTIAGYIDDMI